MQPRTFDDDSVRKTLASLGPRRAAAFAAACAQRILPDYVRFRAKTKTPGIDVVTAALNALWGDLTGMQPISGTAIKELVAAVRAAIPDEEQSAAASEPYAEDAAAAVCFALKSRESGEVQDSIWAAKRVYDALDDYVLRKLPRGRTDESTVLKNDLIQRELSRQARDLDLLASHSIVEDAAKELRARSIEEGKHIWD